MNSRTRQAFLVTSHGRLESELCDRGASVEYVGEVRLRNPLAVVRTRRRVREFIRQFSPDVVIAHDTWPLVVMGPAASGRPLVFYQHESQRVAARAARTSSTRHRGLLY
jgi:UDP-N-acetylglucosamine:LPS N-acetylglucosamine transferase